MKLNNNTISHYARHMFKFFQKFTSLKIDKIYIYIGFELLYNTAVFPSFGGKMIKRSDIFENKITDLQYEKDYTPEYLKFRNYVEDFYSTYLDKNKPTHIKAIYTVATDHLDIEYIYDQLLDEDAGDDFGKIYDEWQYELGMPRPTPIHIPEGHHLEFHSIKKEVFDDQGRVIRIDSELSPVIVKD
jgi:hypothetical protein